MDRGKSGFQKAMDMVAGWACRRSSRSPPWSASPSASAGIGFGTYCPEDASKWDWGFLKASWNFPRRLSMKSTEGGQPVCNGGLVMGAGAVVAGK